MVDLPLRFALVDTGAVRAVKRLNSDQNGNPQEIAYSKQTDVSEEAFT